VVVAVVVAAAAVGAAVVAVVAVAAVVAVVVAVPAVVAAGAAGKQHYSAGRVASVRATGGSLLRRIIFCERKVVRPLQTCPPASLAQVLAAAPDLA